MGTPKRAKAADAAPIAAKIARVYLRVSTDDQDLARQEQIAAPASTARRHRVRAPIGPSFSG